MKKYLAIVLFLLIVPMAYGQTDDVLTLKHEVARERVMRVKAELQLLEARYREGQQMLKVFEKELAEIEKKLKEQKKLKDK
ncbi:hypothetical protein KKF61_08960 [Patescibacteria group bacterium]|nr:hypothetical protein [Patescibacteria group bacterium]